MRRDTNKTNNEKIPLFIVAKLYIVLVGVGTSVVVGAFVVEFVGAGVGVGVAVGVAVEVGLRVGLEVVVF